MLNDPRRPWARRSPARRVNRRAAAILALATSHGESAAWGNRVRRALKILRLPVSVLDIQCGLLPPASRVDPALFVIGMPAPGY